MGLFGRDSQPSPPPTVTGVQPRPKAGVGAPQTATTNVAAGTRVEGTLTGSSNVTVDGQFEGSVAISGNFHVAQSGRVKASVRARTITVSGNVVGDLSSDEKIQLEPTGVVHGNLVAPRILILDGAELQGQVVMSKPTAPDLSIPQKKQSGEDSPAKNPGNNQKK